MVTGGYGSSGLTSVELLSSDGTRLCSMPRLPAARYRHSQSGLLACGGSHISSEYKSCVTFAGGRWKKSHTLGKRRYGLTAWASPRGVLLMGSTHSRTTTDMLTNTGRTIPSFSLGIKDSECQVKFCWVRIN